MIKITDTVKHLIIINVLFFMGTLAFKEKAYDLLAMHYSVPQQELLVLCLIQILFAEFLPRHGE